MPRLTEQLTNKNVMFAPPGRHHGGVKGLYLYVTPDEQVRRWIFRYTSPVTHRVTEHGLGMVADVPLGVARERADTLRRQVAAGICPINAKREARAERAKAVMFHEACAQWIATHKAGWKGVDDGSMMKNAKTLLYGHGKPLARMAVGAITPDDVQRALEKLWAKYPTQARNALTLWERVFDFAKAKGMRQGDNPAAWKGCHEYRFAKRRVVDRGHFAALPYEQVPEFMLALRAKQNRSVAAVALEFVILTACRSAEALGMQWSEVNWDSRVWAVPAERTKQGRVHEVPLSDRAVALLERQKERANGSPFVFTGYGREGLGERAMAWLLRDMGEEATVHGMRSSFRDYCGNETDFKREHVEEALGHVVGSAVERAYRRKPGLEKRRAILAHWAEYCG